MMLLFWIFLNVTMLSMIKIIHSSIICKWANQKISKGSNNYCCHCMWYIYFTGGFVWVGVWLVVCAPSHGQRGGVRLLWGAPQINYAKGTQMARSGPEYPHHGSNLGHQKREKDNHESIVSHLLSDKKSSNGPKYCPTLKEHHCSTNGSRGTTFNGH